jgi:tight adherence protein B
MPAGVLVSFVVVFALVLCAVSVAMKFFEAKRRSQVTGMLMTASGEVRTTLSNLLKEAEPDRPTGIKALLSSLQFSRQAQVLLTEAGMTWTSSRLLAVMGAMAAFGVVMGCMFPFLLNRTVTALTLAVVCGALPYLFVRHKRKKRLAALEEQFPEALDFLARAMRAGHAFSISLEMLGQELDDPLGQEFRGLFNEQNLGATLDVALHNFATRVPLLDARFFTTSVLLQKQTGGNLSEILTRLAYIIRERFRLKGQVRAASAHGRMTAGILTVLPIATMVGLLFVAPGYLQGMAADPDGQKMIAAALVAQVLAKFFINRIIDVQV